MATSEQTIEVVDDGAADQSVFGPSLEQVHHVDTSSQDVVMTDATPTTTSETPALGDKLNDQQPGTMCDGIPATPREIDPIGEASKDNVEDPSIHTTSTPVIECDPTFSAPTSTLTHLAQTPLSNSQPNVSHTPKSTGNRVNATSPPKTPANHADDEPIFLSSQKRSRSSTPARPASAMSAKYSQATPSSARIHSAIQEAQFQTPTKTPGKRSASVQDDPESSKKQKTPVHDTGVNGPPGTSATIGTNTGEATNGQASGRAEEEEDEETMGSDSDEPGDKVVLAQVYSRAKSRIQKLEARLRAITTKRSNEISQADDGENEEIQELKDMVDALQEEIESKDDDIEERDDQIEALQDECDKVRHRNVGLITRLRQMRENDESFLKKFEAHWERQAKQMLEDRNAKKAKEIKDRLARETERLQNKTTKALEEARAIREQSKAEMREVKADRDAKVKAFRPEFNIILRGKDEELKKRGEKILKYQSAFRNFNSVREQIEGEKKDLERDLHDAELEQERLQARHDKIQQQLALTTEMYRNQIVEVDNMKRDHEAEIAVIRGSLEDETLRVEQLEEDLEALNGKLNWHTAALARVEARNVVPEDHKDLPASPSSSGSTVGHTPNTLPGDIIMQDQDIAQELPVKTPGMHYDPHAKAMERSMAEDQHLLRVDSPKAD
jgi:hypothetical protein